MLRPEYENNLRIFIITIPESEIEIEHKSASWVWAWVWDLLVITTPYLGSFASPLSLVLKVSYMNMSYIILQLHFYDNTIQEKLWCKIYICFQIL